jgi:hypothetical protein
MKMFVGVLLLVAMLPCLAFAQGYGENGPKAFTVQAGYFDMKDLDKGLGIGVTYNLPLAGQTARIGLEWGNGSLPVSSAGVSAALTSSSSVNVWNLHLDWILQANPQFYYGLGACLNRVELPGNSENKFGGQAILGYNITPEWFAEARYLAAAEFIQGIKIDGLRATVGYRF